MPQGLQTVELRLDLKHYLKNYSNFLLKTSTTPALFFGTRIIVFEFGNRDPEPGPNQSSIPDLLEMA